LFSIPELGTLGIHHGKVPDYRGKKTTFWAIYNGESEVGVTIQKISDKLDAGDIVRQSTLLVRNRPLPLVRRDLNRIGIDLYLDAIKDMIDGRARCVPQPFGSRSLYKDPTTIDLLRFWGRYVIRLIRGTNAK
jgi:methionyl-tRNA formyltransferase